EIPLLEKNQKNKGLEDFRMEDEASQGITLKAESHSLKNSNNQNPWNVPLMNLIKEKSISIPLNSTEFLPHKCLLE
ncbi:hypothetical protein HispidOSU_006823, partial [Sigmodon hispidus]